MAEPGKTDVGRTDVGKIVVTGAQGQLGRDLVPFLAGQWRVVGVDIDQLDIRDGEAVTAFLREEAPTHVVHAAAFTDVDRCESDHEIAFAVNSDGARHVARACREIGARLIHISTDYVFDGDKDSPYTENDPTHPKTVYGMSKLAGEKAVWEELEDFAILRIAWLYGHYGKNFVRTMLKLAQQQITKVSQGRWFSR